MLNKSKITIKGDAVTPIAEKENINGVSKGLKKKKEPTEER